MGGAGLRNVYTDPWGEGPPPSPPPEALRKGGVHLPAGQEGGAEAI